MAQRVRRNERNAKEAAPRLAAVKKRKKEMFIKQQRDTDRKNGIK
jgi:hypothetical protein